MKLSSKILKVSQLSASQVSHMYSLFSEYYESVNLENFIKDLMDKQFVILLENDRGFICGFTTATVIRGSTAEYPLFRAVFSGDTIIHKDYRGEQQLPVAWFKLAGSIQAAIPSDPLFWFLIVKGEKTYRYLPAFFKQYYPCYNTTTPLSLQSVLDQMASQRFGDCYKPSLGLIKFPQSLGHLKSFETEIKESALKKPEVQFFLKRNPEFHKGDEMVCLAELSTENLKSFARRAFLEGQSICSAIGENRPASLPVSQVRT